MVIDAPGPLQGGSYRTPIGISESTKVEFYQGVEMMTEGEVSSMFQRHSVRNS